MRVQIFPQGTRVRVHGGPFPVDPTVEGRTGLVVRKGSTYGNRYAVQLDGETHLRAFVEEELERLS